MRAWVAAAVGGLIACFAWDAEAIEPAGGSPDPVAETAGEAVGEPAGDPSSERKEPAANAAQDPPIVTSPARRSWLREDTKPVTSDAEPMESSPGTGAMGLAVVLLVGLGMTAVVLKRRRVAPRALAGSGLRVVSTTRLGAKASLVAVDVGGRVLLLGVTDSNVNELGWLDDDDETASEPENHAPEAGEMSEPAEGAVAGVPRSFREVLGGALQGFLPAGKKSTGAPPAARQSAPAPKSQKADAFAGNANVAALLAESTADVLEHRRLARSPSALNFPSTSASRKLKTSASPRPEEKSAAEELLDAPDPQRIEDQVAGLAQRRRR